MRKAGVASALAALTLGLALQISNGHWDRRALALVVTAAILAAIAVFMPFTGSSAAAGQDRAAAPDPGARAARALLGVGAAIGILFHAFAAPALYADPRALAGFHWLAATAAVAVSAYLCLHLRASLVRARFVLLLVCFVAMGAAVVRASPRPAIDVWVFQQRASAALLHGEDPYAATYPDIYGHSGQPMYAPQMTKGDVVSAFPYPPLSILAALPAYALLGDVRFAWLLAMAAAGWLLARGIGGISGELAAVFILFQPRSFFVLEQSWTEPLLLLAVALFLFARQRRWPPELCGLALAMLVAAKQYGAVLALPLFFTIPRGARTRAGLVAAGAGAATIVPFWLWNGPALLRSLVWFHLEAPFRKDALSLLAAWSRVGNVPARAGALSAAAALAALGSWAAACARARRVPTPAEAVAAGAFAWLAVVLFSKQAFCNYYWLCGSLLAAAAAASAGSSREAT